MPLHLIKGIHYLRMKITQHVRTLIIKENNNNPHGGVRELASLLKEKYNLQISKSSIHSVLKAKGLPVKKGRKKHIFKYKKQLVEDCALFLLKSINYEIGLFEYVSGELQVYFSRIKRELLEKFIILLSFSSFLGRPVMESVNRKGLLKLSDLYNLPVRQYKKFLARLKECKPVIAIDTLKKNFQPVSSIKFYFNNGSTGYCDAMTNTFWDSFCYVRDFFLPLENVRKKIEVFLDNKVIMVNYTRSFDYLSLLVLNFIEGISSGINSIQLLDGQGKVLEDIKVSPGKFSYFIGYYPRIISKGMVFLEKSRQFRKLSWEQWPVFYSVVLTRFLQPKTSKGIILNNVFISRKKKFLPCWGIVTNQKDNLADWIKQYLFCWPYMENRFTREMEIFEKFYSQDQAGMSLEKLIPRQLTLEKEEDFAVLGEILLSLFQHRIGSLTLNNDRDGYLRIGKGFCRIYLDKNLALNTRDKFNDACFYINGRRVFLD